MALCTITAPTSSPRWTKRWSKPQSRSDRGRRMVSVAARSRPSFASAAVMFDVAFGSDLRTASAQVGWLVQILGTVLRLRDLAPRDRVAVRKEPREIREMLGLVRFRHSVCDRAPAAAQAKVRLFNIDRRGVGRSLHLRLDQLPYIAAPLVLNQGAPRPMRTCALIHFVRKNRSQHIGRRPALRDFPHSDSGPGRTRRILQKPDS